MKKALLTFLLMILACLIAGVYGALHNQISYTVAPEYFTKFKFYQFQIGASLHGRDGCALVGWRASWWMGLIIGALILPVSLRRDSLKQAFLDSLKAFAVAALLALSTGLLGLLGASLYFDESNAGAYVRYGHEIIDNVAFARAGTMHNCSYLGGLLGVLGAWCFLAKSRWGETLETMENNAEETQESAS